jgi:TetR/AcrR family transcriptional regulator
MRAVPDSIAESLDKAAAVFADRGFDQTRIEDLAEATGVPRATLYYYFAGKEDILAWLLRRMLVADAEAVARAAAGPGTARERLEAVVLTKLRISAAHPHAYRALWADYGRVARMPELTSAVLRGWYEPVGRLLAEGAADGSIRPLENPETAAAAVYGAVNITAAHYLFADGRLDPERVAAELCPLLLKGLQPAGVDTLTT